MQNSGYRIHIFLADAIIFIYRSFSGTLFRRKVNSLSATWRIKAPESYHEKTENGRYICYFLAKVSDGDVGMCCREADKRDIVREAGDPKAVLKPRPKAI